MQAPASDQRVATVTGLGGLPQRPIFRLPLGNAALLILLHTSGITE
jgi:hypothetical protein